MRMLFIGNSHVGQLFESLLFQLRELVAEWEPVFFRVGTSLDQGRYQGMFDFSERHADSHLASLLVTCTAAVWSGPTSLWQ